METLANHLVIVETLSKLEPRTHLSIVDSSLAGIQETIKLFGGSITLTKINDQTNSANVLISAYSEIGNCQFWVHVFTTKLAIMLQKEAFNADFVKFEKGTNLTIIDNQYLVLSDAK